MSPDGLRLFYFKIKCYITDLVLILIWKYFVREIPRLKLKIHNRTYKFTDNTWYMCIVYVLYMFHSFQNLIQFKWKLWVEMYG